MANWLALKEPHMQTNIMRSQLSRLYGQLNAFRGAFQDALQVWRLFRCSVSLVLLDGLNRSRTRFASQAFSEDILFSSKEYGPDDPRTSLGYFNMARIFFKTDRKQECLACCDKVAEEYRKRTRRRRRGKDSIDSCACTLSFSTAFPGRFNLEARTFCRFIRHRRETRSQGLIW